MIRIADLKKLVARKIRIYTIDINNKMNKNFLLLFKFKQMRKMYFLVALLCAILSISCTNSGLYIESSNVSNIENHSELLSQITSFNDSILAAKKKTRAVVKSGAWKRAKIIAADCGGAYSGGRAGLWAGALLGPDGAIAGGFLGGLIGGVCGSYVAWESTSPTTRATSLDPIDIELVKERTIKVYANILRDSNAVLDYVPKNINVQYPVIDENVTLMGAKHNLILSKLINGDDISIDGVQQLSEDQIKIINSKGFSESFNNAMNDICDNIRQGDSMSLAGEDISTKLMNMFYNILIKYPEGLDDIEYLINKYIEAVKDSREIEESDKELIYSGLSVAASSSEFWSEN